MGKLLRLGGWALLGLALLWVVFEIVGFVFGIVSWVVSTAISLAVVAVLLYLGYVLASRFLGGGGASRPRSESRSQSSEREKIFE